MLFFGILFPSPPLFGTFFYLFQLPFAFSDTYSFFVSYANSQLLSTVGLTLGIYEAIRRAPF